MWDSHLAWRPCGVVPTARCERASGRTSLSRVLVRCPSPLSPALSPEQSAGSQFANSASTNWRSNGFSKTLQSREAHRNPPTARQTLQRGALGRARDRIEKPTKPARTRPRVRTDGGRPAHHTRALASRGWGGAGVAPEPRLDGLRGNQSGKFFFFSLLLRAWPMWGRSRAECEFFLSAGVGLGLGRTGACGPQSLVRAIF